MLVLVHLWFREEEAWSRAAGVQRHNLLAIKGTSFAMPDDGSLVRCRCEELVLSEILVALRR